MMEVRLNVCIQVLGQTIFQNASKLVAWSAGEADLPKARGKAYAVFPKNNYNGCFLSEFTEESRTRILLQGEGRRKRGFKNFCLVFALTM